MYLACPPVNVSAITFEYLEAEILNISKSNVVVQVDEWDLAGVTTSMPPSRQWFD
jgi:hypothetical protein